jgi:DNA repair protein RadC
MAKNLCLFGYALAAQAEQRHRQQGPFMGQQSKHEPSDIELLATLICGGGQTTAALDIAARLLERFGSVRQVLDADSASILCEQGIGNARAARLLAVPDLARRYYEESLPAGATIKSPADTETFLLSRMRHLGHELFCCLFLDNRHRVLRFDEMFRGTIDGTSVYPREVVKEALAINAAAVILAHNHPSGVAEPSQAVKSALELVDIRLLDHLIIGDGRATSLANRGLV